MFSRRIYAIILSCLCVVCISTCRYSRRGAHSKRPSPIQALGFNEYNGYFISNRVDLADSLRCMVFQTKTAFDSLFRAVPPPLEQDTIETGAFDSSTVVAVVKVDKGQWDIMVDEVRLKDDTLYVGYYADRDISDTTRIAAVPAVALVPQCRQYSAVVFLENGRRVATSPVMVH